MSYIDQWKNMVIANLASGVLIHKWVYILGHMSSFYYDYVQ